MRQTGDDISVFLAVCEAGSFAAASARLGVTASAVAKAVARLEGRLKTRLFHRTTRRLAPTAEAIIYREACQEARDRIERVEAELASFSAEPSGIVRLSLPPLLGTQVIAPALYALCHQWHHLRFDISTSTGLTDLPGDGVDVAVRIGQLPDLSGVTARHLGVQSVVLCGAPAYFVDRRYPKEVRELSEHSLIASSRNGRAASWYFDMPDGDRVTYEPSASLLLDGSALTLSAIRGGHGLGLVPAWLVADEIASGALVPILEDRISGHLPVNALWVTSPVMLPRLRLTIDAIVRSTCALLAAP
ncbi:LysR family transcriptional regulator [Novosphingobium sp. fls2-241-R2A-195]|jgi:DNA-binding transcriptional LysR family regulator|uniref:LysR family transcriptional regulator n=1 Tax=Novosphingobium sp. fls2-241-R2A-195 TaxID=3040296 RepID=UPI00254FF091|nr:LysR family transcriptional regulator [Novosphingobium sp. fls2-241-R2A-195]